VENHACVAAMVTVAADAADVKQVDAGLGCKVESVTTDHSELIFV